MRRHLITRIRTRTVLALLAAGAIAVIGSGAPRPAGAAALNACGCREGAPGQCVCEKKSRCGCPGECEPRGCEEKRAKQLEKEIQAETKKAEEAQRRQRVRQEKDEKNEKQNDQHNDVRRESDKSDRSPSSSAGKEARERESHDRSADQPAPAKKVRIVKMTPAQKRDLAKLISAYLAEHPDQGGKAIDQVQSELRR